MDRTWSDGWWMSSDGIRLHYRDYPGPRDRPPILCIPGLTRNARDFEALAHRLSPDWRVLCVELRGRGESGPAKDPMSYAPVTYAADIEALVTELGLTRFVLFGTSLGGIVSMLVTAGGAERVAAVLLNDVGPALEARGLDRIKGYVGKNTAYPTWLHAARALAEGQGHAYPRYDLTDWLAMAKRLCRLTPGGRIVFDYDMKIAEPMRLAPPTPAFDLWPVASSLKGRPVTLVRGALTDLLSEATAARMVRELGLELVTVPDTGHAPTLDEPEAQAAITRLLARVGPLRSVP